MQKKRRIIHNENTNFDRKRQRLVNVFLTKVFEIQI